MKYAPLALACLCATSLSAETRLKGGVITGLMAPVGDFASKSLSNGEPLGANSGLGLHLGGHLDLHFDRHHELRLHGTIQAFAGEEKELYNTVDDYYTRQNTFSIVQIGGDYLYNFRSPESGGYLLAGLNLNSVAREAKYTGRTTYWYSDSDTEKVTQSGCIGMRLGGGVNLGRVFSLEATLNSISVDAGGLDGMGMDQITWIGVSAVFHWGR